MGGTHERPDAADELRMGLRADEARQQRAVVTDEIDRVCAHEIEVQPGSARDRQFTVFRDHRAERREVRFLNRDPINQRCFVAGRRTVLSLEPDLVAPRNRDIEIELMAAEKVDAFRFDVTDLIGGTVFTHPCRNGVFTVRDGAAAVNAGDGMEGEAIGPRIHKGDALFRKSRLRQLQALEAFEEKGPVIVG